MSDSPNEGIYRWVLEMLPIAVCAVNRDGKVILWNEGAERVTGYLRQDVLGHPCTDKFLEHTDPNDNALTENIHPLVETMREGKCLALRASLRKRSGQSVSVHLRTVPLRGDDGRLQGAAELFDELFSHAPVDRRQDKLAALGCLDHTTGILNHSMIHAHLQEALSLYRVYPVPFCVACVSVDELAKTRDRFGQAAVDSTLRVVAETLQSGLRPTDHLGRWLDQEFLVILNECGEEDVLKVAERLRRMVQHANVKWWGDSWAVTVSIGITPVHDQDSVSGAVSRAEQGMRDANAAGGNQIVIHKY